MWHNLNRASSLCKQAVQQSHTKYAWNRVWQGRRATTWLLEQQRQQQQQQAHVEMGSQPQPQPLHLHRLPSNLSKDPLLPPHFLSFAGTTSCSAAFKNSKKGFSSSLSLPWATTGAESALLARLLLLAHGSCVTAVPKAASLLVYMPAYRPGPER